VKKDVIKPMLQEIVVGAMAVVIVIFGQDGQ
jgi:hypothetical protein